MNNLVAWIAAEAERPRVGEAARRRSEEKVSGRELAAHQFPAKHFSSEPGAATVPSGAPTTEKNPHFSQNLGEVGHPQGVEKDIYDNSHPVAQNATRVGHPEESEYQEDDRERRIYRGRTVAMLRRYLRYSIETGRLPSLLGKEFFRAKVTAYTVVSFEDRVIFVHDMESCLDRLDEFSRQLIARHILQEHDQAATARLLHCSERTVRSWVPVALDLLSEILVEVGLLERVESIQKNSCQEGEMDQISASDWEDGK